MAGDARLARGGRPAQEGQGDGYDGKVEDEHDGRDGLDLLAHARRQLENARRASTNAAVDENALAAVPAARDCADGGSGVYSLCEGESSSVPSSALAAGLRVADPHSFYDSDEFDSAGLLAADRRAERAQHQQAERQRRAESRRAPTPHSGVKRFTPAATDASGSVVFPIEVRGMMVHDLGRIVSDRGGFHEKRYIWPAGFRSEREYSSMTTLDRRCRYVSEIVDRGDDAPIFVVTCLDPAREDPIVIEGTTASGVWREIGERYFNLRKELTGFVWCFFFGCCAPSLSSIEPVCGSR
jgi:F/Y-rich N-terminus